MKYEVDLSGVTAPADLHRQLQEVLPLPEWYGCNLDALSDVLTEEGDGWDIVLLNVGDFEDACPAYAAALYRLCLQAMDAVPELHITISDD